MNGFYFIQDDSRPSGFAQITVRGSEIMPNLVLYAPNRKIIRSAIREAEPERWGQFSKKLVLLNDDVMKGILLAGADRLWLAFIPWLVSLNLFRPSYRLKGYWGFAVADCSDSSIVEVHFKAKGLHMVPYSLVDDLRKIC